MPILPIDLQTMFSQMNHVGKDQAVQKEVTPQHQTLQGQEIAEKTLEKDHTVNESEEVGKGIEKTKNKKKNQKKSGESSRKEKKEKEDTKKENDTTEVYKDPNLGHHIDIIG